MRREGQSKVKIETNSRQGKILGSALMAIFAMAVSGCGSGPLPLSETSEDGQKELTQGSKDIVASISKITAEMGRPDLSGLTGVELHRKKMQVLHDVMKKAFEDNGYDYDETLMLAGDLIDKVKNGGGSDSVNQNLDGFMMMFVMGLDTSALVVAADGSEDKKTVKVTDSTDFSPLETSSQKALRHYLMAKIALGEARKEAERLAKEREQKRIEEERARRIVVAKSFVDALDVGELGFLPKVISAGEIGYKFNELEAGFKVGKKGIDREDVSECRKKLETEVGKIGSEIPTDNLFTLKGRAIPSGDNNIRIGFLLKDSKTESAVMIIGLNYNNEKMDRALRKAEIGNRYEFDVNLISPEWSYDYKNGWGFTGTSGDSSSDFVKKYSEFSHILMKNENDGMDLMASAFSFKSRSSGRQYVQGGGGLASKYGINAFYISGLIKRIAPLDNEDEKSLAIYKEANQAVVDIQRAKDDESKRLVQEEKDKEAAIAKRIADAEQASAQAALDSKVRQEQEKALALKKISDEEQAKAKATALVKQKAEKENGDKIALAKKVTDSYLASIVAGSIPGREERVAIHKLMASADQKQLQNTSSPVLQGTKVNIKAMYAKIGNKEAETTGTLVEIGNPNSRSDSDKIAIIMVNEGDNMQVKIRALMNCIPTVHGSISSTLKAGDAVSLKYIPVGIAEAGFNGVGLSGFTSPSGDSDFAKKISAFSNGFKYSYEKTVNLILPSTIPQSVTAKIEDKNGPYSQLNSGRYGIGFFAMNEIKLTVMTVVPISIAKK